MLLSDHEHDWSIRKGAIWWLSTRERESAEELVLRAEVHVQKLAGWWLPGPTEALQLVEVKVDGVPTRQLRREPGGLTAVRLEPGRHTVELRGRLAGRNVVTLQLDEATKHPSTDTLAVADLKRRKFLLKDEITRLKGVTVH